MREGRRQQSPMLDLWIAPGNAAEARLGLVVGKRWGRRAVDRNTVKRILRESFRHEAGQLPVLDVVIRLRQSWDAERRTQLAAETQRLLRGLAK